MCKYHNTKHNEKLRAKHLGLRMSEETPIYISEQLTPKAARLFFLGRELIKQKLYKYCWTSYGNIYLRRDDGTAVIQIVNEAQITQLSRFTWLYGVYYLCALTYCANNNVLANKYHFSLIIFLHVIVFTRVFPMLDTCRSTLLSRLEQIPVFMSSELSAKHDKNISTLLHSHSPTQQKTKGKPIHLNYTIDIIKKVIFTKTF